MTDQHFLSSPATDSFGPLHGGERVIWRGRCGVAEYAFHEAESLPLWTLPEDTEVLVTDQRVRFSCAGAGAGEVRWLWPQHLRVQPGSRSTDRGTAATQVQLVCAGADGGWPALVLAGGDLTSVAEADHLANAVRQAIARFRVDHADKLGLTTPQARMLSRLLMAPEFRNHQGGDGQTVSLLGALPVHRSAAPPAEDTRQIKHRPGLAADAVRAMMAAQAEMAAQQAEPDRASRAAELAARVADLVSQSARESWTAASADARESRPAEPAAAHPSRATQPAAAARQSRPTRPTVSSGMSAGEPPGFGLSRHTGPTSHREGQPSGLDSAESGGADRTEPGGADRTEPDGAGQGSPEQPPARPDQVRNMRTLNLAEKAKAVRRSAARMAANAARNRTSARYTNRNSDAGSRGHHRG